MWGRYLGPSLYVLSAVGILFGCGPVPVQKRFREHLNVGDLTEILYQFQ